MGMGNVTVSDEEVFDEMESPDCLYIVYIFDASDVSKPKCRGCAHLIIVTLFEKSLAVFICPIWSLEELKLACQLPQHNQLKIVVEKRFQIFGGIARYIKKGKALTTNF